MSGRFEHERAVVVGAGVAGLAAAKALAEEGALVRVTEARALGDVPEVGPLAASGIEFLAGGHDPAHFDGATLVVTSPGVFPAAPVLGWARERGLPIWGELELGAHLADAPYVAVTGTNGKTTVTGMVAGSLREGGLDAVACGNIGAPFPTAARERHDVMVVECSSFQLEQQGSFHPRVSILLNLAPDHLDWHGSYEAYAGAKAKIYALQGEGDVHIGNRDDPDAATLSERAPCRIVWFGLGMPDQGETGFEGQELVARIGSRSRLGAVDGGRAGYRADAAAAAATALAFGVSTEAVARGISGYVPERHRGEVVAEVDGVRFVDNSKATNVHAAMAAIAVARDAVLIAGGLAKGVDLSPLRTCADRLSGVVAIGEAQSELVEVFEGTVPVRPATSIEEATRIAFELVGPGGTVLLAPACASWDQFRDYAERGDRFAEAARSLGSVRAHG